MTYPNPLVKAWKYLSAWFSVKVDENADPKVQLEQAIQEAQRQHQALTRQAAEVIGNQRQLQLQLDRQLNTIEELQAQTREALVLSGQARADGDEAKAARFETTAQALANQLVSAESAVEDLKTLHDQALEAAGQAREAVQTNAQLLQQRLAERAKLLTQLEQAKMQEAVAASLQQLNDGMAPGTVPTLDEVRDKIERRYAIALGSAELARATPAGLALEVQQAARDRLGAARLAEIRAALATEPKPALAEGATATDDSATHLAQSRADGPAGTDPAGDRPVDTTKPAASPRPDSASAQGGAG